MNENEKNQEKETEKKSGALKKPAIIAIIAALVIAVVVGVLFIFLPKSNNNTENNNVTEAAKDNTNVTRTADANPEDCLKIYAVVEGDGAVAAGDTVTVTVKLENVSKLASLMLTAEWDKELTLVDAAYGPELNGLKYSPDVDDKLAGWAGVESPFNFNWVALDSENELNEDCTYLTVQFKTDKDKPGTYKLNLSANENNIFDTDYNNIPFTLTGAEIVVEAAK